MPTTTYPVFGSPDTLIYGVLSRFFEGHGVHVGTLFQEDLRPPFVIAREERRSGTMAMVSHDDRFLRPIVVSVNTFAEGPDADDECFDLQEACRIGLREAWRDQLVIPDGGHISAIENSTRPSRVSDWATSTGVVQYASLPKGWVRYESIYRLLIRPPAQATITNRFVQPASE